MDIWKVPLFDGADSETESNIPIFYIKSSNECLSLITSDAENFMCQIHEEMQLWPYLEYLLFQMDIVNKEKKAARHKLMQSFVLNLNVKPEHPKSWDLMVWPDRINSRQYSLISSMDPENIIKENNNIPYFVYEYFAQKEKAMVRS